MSERPSEFLTLANNTKADFASAMARGCNDDGHKAMGTAGVRTVEMLVIMHTDMKDGFAEMLKIPDSTVTKLRNEVVTLVDSHAEDAVIRHLARRVPVDGNGRAVSVTRDTSPQLSGFWGGAFQMLQKVGVPGAIVSACAVVGLALWVVLEVVRK
jgi:hypothetical protein